MSISLEDREIIQALCESAWEHPQAMVEVLEQLVEPWVTSEGELHLGEAAVQHPELRKALMANWQRRTGDERGSFPGGALAALVARDDLEAVEIYAQWLRETIWLKAPFASPFFSPVAIRHSRVRPVAIELVMDIWSQYKDGRVKDGKRVYLAGSTMASALRALRPAWEDVTNLREEITRHARDVVDTVHSWEDPRNDALRVFSGPPYPKELGDLLVDGFGKFAEKAHDEGEPWHIAFWIDWAERASVADKLQSSLEDMCAKDSWLRYQALSVRVLMQPRLAARLSQGAAEGWPDFWSADFLPQSTLARLVRANVSAWQRRLMEVLNWDSLPIQAVFQLAWVLSRLLPPVQRDTVQAEFYKKLGGLELFWIQNGRDPWDAMRCSDLFAQLVFETGGGLARRGKGIGR
jgi:hypothetical protein